MDDPQPSTSKDVFKAPSALPVKKKSQLNTSVSSIETEDDNISTTSSLSNRKPYSRAEEEKIVKWIVDTKRFTEIRGNSMWQLMEEAKLLEDRTWQSMKERFRKHILKNIGFFNISESNKEAFRRLERRSNAKKKGFKHASVQQQNKKKWPIYSTEYEIALKISIKSI